MKARDGEPLRPRDKILEELEEIALLQGLCSTESTDLSGGRNSHRTDDILVSHFGELVVIVETRDPDFLLALVDIRLGEGEGDTVDHFQLVEQAVVLLAPLAVEELPFLACELEDVGGCAVVFACAHEVLGKVAAGEIPVCAEQMEAV